MRLRDLLIKLPQEPGMSFAKRLALALEGAIRDGRLKPGAALPGSRALAEMLEVNRKTILVALKELEAQGWLVTRPDHGTYVASEPPLIGGPPVAPPRGGQPGFDLPSQLSPISQVRNERGDLDLGEGLTDASLFPMTELAKAQGRALQMHGPRLLQEPEPLGSLVLRTTLAEWLAERRGIALRPDQMLLTRGSPSALSLVGLGLLKPGDAVGVEEPGNRSAWETLHHGAKVRLVPIPVDDQGLQVEALEEILGKERLRALYLTPKRQYPTTVTLSPARRTRLLEVAARHRLALIEDDHDGDHAFGRRPPLPLAHEDGAGLVIYTSDLAQLVAPGLRLGFIVAPHAFIARLARLQRHLEGPGDRALEWAVADLMRDGELTRHLRRVRLVYQARRDRLLDLLHRHLGEALEVHSPDGGLALWLGARPGWDMARWVQGAAREGLRLHAPARSHLGEPGRFPRMGFPQVKEEEPEEAVALLVRAETEARI